MSYPSFVLESFESRSLFSVSLSVGSNINISRASASEAEGAISIDPTNSNRLFVFANNDRGGMFTSYSTDAGKTWHNKIIANGKDKLPRACCDPSASFDQFGNLFICYLTEDHEVVVDLSIDGGKTFKFLKQLTSQEVDQPTLVTGPGSNKGKGSVWINFSSDDGDVLVTGATVNGKNSIGSFSKAKKISGASGNFGDMAVGPAGQVIVGWQDNVEDEGPTNLYAAIDPDGAGPKSFGSKIKIARSNVGGFDLIPAQKHRSIDSELGFAWDRSNSKNRGRIYAVYTDESPDESNNTDIYLRYSKDNGKTWSSAKKVNDDKTKTSQFMPRIAIDQTTGNIAMSWYDARNTSNKTRNDQVQFYAAVTTDGGNSISKNVRVSVGTSKPSDVGDGFEFGDYSGLAFHKGSFYPLWADNSGSVKNPNRPIPDLVTARVTLKFA